MALAFRIATPDDLERLLEIHMNAFPDPRVADARRRNFIANPLGLLGDLHVAMRGDEIVAHAFLFALEAWFGGARVKTGAIASVGVAPEARGQGAGAALLDYLHHASNARGDAITLLHAFRQGFYARHGYAAVTPVKRLSVHPASIPAWKDASVRRARGEDRDAIVQAYERMAARKTGWLARPAALWMRMFQDERRVLVVAERDAKIRGYIAWSLSQAESHAATRLTVHEVVADDETTRRSLIGVAGAQRDQVAEVVMEVDAADPLDRALVDADRARFGTDDVEHTIGAIVAGPMVRLGDVARAIEARGYACDGAIDVAVEGTTMRVEVRDGHARTQAAEAPSALRVERTTLAAILYGALAPSDAARLGMIDADAATLSRADALFALAPYHAVDSF